MDIKKIMPTTWLLVAILLVLALHFVIPGPKVIPAGWNLLGILPVVIGVTLNMVADKDFHRANTTVKPFQVSSALLTGGVFRLSRNPMYLGFVLILFGLAFLLRTVSPYLVVVVFAIFIDRVFIQGEEEMLSRDFGVDWEAYCKKTRRWL